MPKSNSLSHGEIFAIRDVEQFDLFVRFAGENEGDPPTVLRIAGARGVELSPDAVNALDKRIQKLEAIST